MSGRLIIISLLLAAVSACGTTKIVTTPPTIVEVPVVVQPPLPYACFFVCDEETSTIVTNGDLLNKSKNDDVTKACLKAKIQCFEDSMMPPAAK